MSETDVYRITVVSEPRYGGESVETHLVTGDAFMRRSVAGFKGRRGWAGRTLSISVERLEYTAVRLAKHTWEAKP